MIPYKPVILDDPEFEAFLNEWITCFAKELKSAWPSIKDTDEILYNYILSAKNVSMSDQEIVDYFCVSCPGIADNVEFDEFKKESLISRFDMMLFRINDEFSQ